MRTPGVLLAVCLLLLGTSLACTMDQLVGALAVADGGIEDDDGGMEGDGGVEDDDGGESDDNGDGGRRDGGGGDGGDEARAFPRSE